MGAKLSVWMACLGMAVSTGSTSALAEIRTIYFDHAILDFDFTKRTGQIRTEQKAFLHGGNPRGGESVENDTFPGLTRNGLRLDGREWSLKDLRFRAEEQSKLISKVGGRCTVVKDCLAVLEAQSSDASRLAILASSTQKLALTQVTYVDVQEIVSLFEKKDLPLQIIFERLSFVSDEEGVELVLSWISDRNNSLTDTTARALCNHLLLHEVTKERENEALKLRIVKIKDALSPLSFKRILALISAFKVNGPSRIELMKLIHRGEITNAEDILKLMTHLETDNDRLELVKYFQPQIATFPFFDSLEILNQFGTASLKNEARRYVLQH